MTEQTLENQPRGVRNNNPGNLREVGIDWNGRVGKEDGFTVFSAAIYGIRALAVCLYNSNKTFDRHTIQVMIEHYAPPSENDTRAYIHYVSAFCGVGPNVEIDLSHAPMAFLMIRAIIIYECGYRKGGAEWYTKATILEGMGQAGRWDNLTLV
jgi:hypothetical protein